MRRKEDAPVLLGTLGRPEAATMIFLWGWNDHTFVSNLSGEELPAFSHLETHSPVISYTQCYILAAAFTIDFLVIFFVCRFFPEPISAHSSPFLLYVTRVTYIYISQDNQL